MKPVRKVFTETDRAGSDTDYWEGTWDALDLETERAQVSGGALEKLLSSYIGDAGARVLEAGCGTGAVAVGLGSIGHEVVGVDLAGNTLRRARRTWPDFRGAVGDVRQMPFADRTFDAVVSLGVLEHEEAGPQPALLEHRRVIREGGLLLVTVPRISPLKSIRDTWNLGIRRRSGYYSRGRWVERRNGVDSEASDRQFHQYEFRPRDWQEMVRDAGFEIVGGRSLGVGAGLGDLEGLLRHMRSGPRAARHPAGMAARQELGEEQPNSRSRERLKRLKHAITSEEAVASFDHVLVGASQHLLGHMQLTVARRKH